MVTATSSPLAPRLTNHASINRIAAWVIGTRNTIKALLLALLEPTAKLSGAENVGDLTSRLALIEELKSLPFGAVWDEHCRHHNVPFGIAWLNEGPVGRAGSARQSDPSNQRDVPPPAPEAR